ncbi:MAG: hypothetical protein ABJG47_11820 [Ekhidna sp.]
MKNTTIFIFLCATYMAQSQNLKDTTYVANVTLDEVVVFGENKVRTTKIGYLKKENFTFSLYQNYEIGVFIRNSSEYSRISDVYLMVNNDLPDKCEIELNFYEFNDRPTKLINTVNAKVLPLSKKKQVITTSDNIDIEFPKEGIFVSTRIKSELSKDDKLRFKVYLSEKYNSKSTFIRGSIYGDSWIEFSELKIRNLNSINVCYGVFAKK